MPMTRILSLSFLIAGAAASAGPAEELRFPAKNHPDAAWLISDWPAGQSRIVSWTPENVRKDGGAIELVLDDSDSGERPYRGGEIQSRAVAENGVWQWRATAPRMEEGAVFGMFLFSADYQNDPWREYDFEFVGSDTTQVQLNIHFEDEGRHVSLDRGGESKVLVDLGFDAAEAPHLYEIEVGDREAIFRIDGAVVGRFGPEDMPGGIWSRGLLRSFVDLWPVPPELSEWAGTWRREGEPLVARIHALGLPADAREAP